MDTLRDKHYLQDLWEDEAHGKCGDLNINWSLINLIRIMEDIKQVLPSFWRKKVFLTGIPVLRWLALVVAAEYGCNFKGILIKPNTSPNLFDVASVAEDMESEIGDIEILRH